MMTQTFLIHIALVCCLNIFFETSATEDDSVCNPGQYGRWCLYNCSSFCNFDKCSISDHRGVPECNEGCKKYHTGFFCQEFCPSLCLECNQTDSTCHKCIDGYYGLTCNQTCHSNCINGTCHTIDGSCILAPHAGGNNTRPKRGISEELCHKMTEDEDVCQCCRTGRRGDRCEQVCQNCQTYYVPLKVCQYQCKAGYYGNTCDKECPEACQPGNSGKPLCEITSEGLRCMNGCNRGYTGLQCKDKCSENCKDTCYQLDGKCVDCPNGKYGDMCNKNCSLGCKKHVCSNKDGSCQGGCEIGFYRDNCIGICGDNCANSKCEEHVDGANPNTTFLCSEGCKNGYKGRSCDEVCPKHCLICKQLSDDGCVQCDDGFHLETGPVQSSCYEAIPELAMPVVIILTIAVTLVVTFAAITCVLKRRQLRSFLPTCIDVKTPGRMNSTQEEEQLPMLDGEALNQVPQERRDQNNNSLTQACRTGNLEAVKTILRHNKEDINVKGRHGMTPVMEAIGKGHMEVVDFLVQKGCELKAVDNANNTVLHVACDRGNVEFVKDLLKRVKFDINARCSIGRSPLMIAARNGNIELFDLLKTKGGDVKTMDAANDTILHVACFNKNIRFVKHLLPLRLIDINVKGCKGRTPVMVAAYCGYMEMLKLFWSQEGLERLQKDGNNDTILHVACYNDNVDIVRYLLSENIFQIEVKGFKSRTPAMIAAQNACRKVFELLVEKGCDLTVTDEKNHNILTLACCSDNVSFVEYLLKLEKFDINSKGNKGRTPLLVATSKGCSGVFHLLVKNGSLLSAKDENNDGVMSLAHGSFEKELVTMNILNDIITA